MADQTISQIADSVTVLDGGSVQTKLSWNVVLNERSSLHRKWVIVNDPTAPVLLNGTGILSKWEKATEYSAGQYQYEQAGQVQILRPVTAFEVRYVLYGVFGAHLQTLTGAVVADLTAGSTVVLKDLGRWNAWSEPDVAQLLTIVSFLANARTNDGVVWQYDESRIGAAVAEVQIKVTDGSLTPSIDKRS